MAQVAVPPHGLSLPAPPIAGAESAERPLTPAAPTGHRQEKDQEDEFDVVSAPMAPAPLAAAPSHASTSGWEFIANSLLPPEVFEHIFA